MTLRDIVKATGLKLAGVRKHAKRLGLTYQDRNGYVRLSEVDAARLTAAIRGIDCDDAPGLPVEALADPAMREAFTRLRFEREHRLIELIAHAGLPVGRTM